MIKISVAAATHANQRLNFEALTGAEDANLRSIRDMLAVDA